MANLPTNQNLSFDTELTLTPADVTTPQLLGVLTNNPVILLVKNLTNQIAFFADNNGTTKGTTMSIGEEFVLDCRGNAGKAMNMGFGAGTAFYASFATTATGIFKVSVLYAY